MDDERRAMLKLSDEVRVLWEDTEALFATPSALTRPEPFSGLRRRLQRLPRNQRRYYRTLVRLNSERF